MQIIKITEKDLVNLIQESVNTILEGVNWHKNSNNTVNLRINSNQTDEENSSSNNVDTRIFGTKNDIMFGDGTSRSLKPGVSNKLKQKLGALKHYRSLLSFLKNNRNGDLYMGDDVDLVTRNNTIKNLNNPDINNDVLIDKATKYIDTLEYEYDMLVNQYNRSENKQNTDKIGRYQVGRVNGTNVNYIALFTMGDFNFSDAIKHGEVRQNPLTDTLLGINKGERVREPGKVSYTKIPVTYDNGIPADIDNNFSLKNVRPGHFKQNFVQNDKNYTSVTQFIDKSIMYAAYALKKENYKPDFIVAAPSSSRFNDLYCHNLSQKLGIPYIKDFFKRNLINVRFNKNEDTQIMKQKGFSDQEIMQFENNVKRAVYSEISYFVCQPLYNFFNENYDIFANITTEFHGREKIPFEYVYDCIINYAYDSMLPLIKDPLSTHLVDNFLKETKKKLYTKNYDSQRIFNEVVKRIKLKIGTKYFMSVLREMQNVVINYSQQLAEKGIRLNVKRFKITSFEKRFRPFLHNVYIISDTANVLNKNGELMKQYANGKFLIFDEDINSGATLKLVIEALEEKLPKINSQQIMCLVNAYSSGGF